MASRKLRAPRTALYQDGRGSDPIIDVGRTTLADPLNMMLSPGACLLRAFAPTGATLHAAQSQHESQPRLSTLANDCQRVKVSCYRSGSRRVREERDDSHEHWIHRAR